jgi:carboxyl-terminal processing protease
MRATNKVQGIALDLRFAIGQEYQAAAETADLFFNTEQPLLKWGEQSFRSRAKSNAIDLPFVVLVNGSTSGAAEALAAALGQAEGALVIGSPSAGRAYLFKDIPLGTGQILRVASGWVSSGENRKLSEDGLTPDIRVAVNPEEEKAFFEDPYKAAPKSLAQSSRTNQSETASSTRVRRRPNEADLVRMQREGIDFSTELALASGPAATVATVTDPVLARALDLLKGLALALKRR